MRIYYDIAISHASFQFREWWYSSSIFTVAAWAIKGLHCDFVLVVRWRVIHTLNTKSPKLITHALEVDFWRDKSLFFSVHIRLYALGGVLNSDIKYVSAKSEKLNYRLHIACCKLRSLTSQNILNVLCSKYDFKFETRHKLGRCVMTFLYLTTG
jgi:hypothetical protein